MILYQPTYNDKRLIMAKGKKTGGKNFIKGQSGNPNGRPKVPEDLKTIQSLSPSLMSKLINKYMAMNREQIIVKVKDPRTPMIETTIASILVKATQSGDYTRLNFLLDRSIGKVKDEIDVRSSHTIYTTSFRPDGSLVQDIMNAELGEESDAEEV